MNPANFHLRSCARPGRYPRKPALESSRGSETMEGIKSKNTGYAGSRLSNCVGLTPLINDPLMVKAETPHPLIPLPLARGERELFFVRLTQGGGRPENGCRKRTS